MTYKPEMIGPLTFEQFMEVRQILHKRVAELGLDWRLITAIGNPWFDFTTDGEHTRIWASDAPDAMKIIFPSLDLERLARTTRTK